MFKLNSSIWMAFNKMMGHVPVIGGLYRWNIRFSQRHPRYSTFSYAWSSVSIVLFGLSALVKRSTSAK